MGRPPQTLLWGCIVGVLQLKETEAEGIQR